MATRNELNDWQADEAVSARKLNEMTRGIRAVTPLTAGKGTRVYTSPTGGTAISVDDKYLLSDKTVVSMITTEVTPGGEYLGMIALGSSTADGVSPSTMPAGMTLPDEDDALLLHPPELGTGDHNLDAGTWVIGVNRGTVGTGTHAGKTIVIIQSLLSPAEIIGVVKFTATANMSVVNGRKIAATSATTGPETVACVYGHKSGDTIVAAQPAGGTGVSGTTWLELGPLGVDFEVETEVASGTGTPTDPFFYQCKRGSSVFSASSAPIYRPVNMTADAAAEFGRGRFVPGLDTFELAWVYETFSPMVPVLVQTPTPGAGGGDPGTTNYTIRDIVTLATIATGVSHPNRPFGDTFKVVTGGTRGEGYYLTDGTFVLVNIFGEVYSTTPGCPPPP